MLKKTKLLIILISIALLQSCNPRSSSLMHYSPNEANMLKVIEAKDFKISGSIKNGIENDDEDKYFAIQAGYSPRQNLGISGGYFLLKPQSPGLFQMANLSVGGYHLWLPKYTYRNSKKVENEWSNLRGEYGQVLMPFGFLLEAYAGIDLGRIKHKRSRFLGTNNIKEEAARLNLIRYFVKTGIHFQDRLFGCSLVSKIGWMDYHKGLLEIEGGSVTGLFDYYFNAINYNNGFFVEPALNVHFGTQTLRGYFGLTVPFLLNKKDALRKKEQLWTIGVVLDIDNLRRE